MFLSLFNYIKKEANKRSIRNDEKKICNDMPNEFFKLPFNLEKDDLSTIDIIFTKYENNFKVYITNIFNFFSKINNVDINTFCILCKYYKSIF